MSTITFIDYILSKRIVCPYLSPQNETHLTSIECYLYHIKNCEYKNNSTELYRKALQNLIDFLINEMYDYNDYDINYVYNKCLKK